MTSTPLPAEDLLNHLLRHCKAAQFGSRNTLTWERIEDLGLDAPVTRSWRKYSFQQKMDGVDWECLEDNKDAEHQLLCPPYDRPLRVICFLLPPWAAEPDKKNRNKTSITNTSGQQEEAGCGYNLNLGVAFRLREQQRACFRSCNEASVVVGRLGRTHIISTPMLRLELVCSECGNTCLPTTPLHYANTCSKSGCPRCVARGGCGLLPGLSGDAALWCKRRLLELHYTCGRSMFNTFRLPGCWITSPNIRVLCWSVITKPMSWPGCSVGC